VAEASPSPRTGVSRAVRGDRRLELCSSSVGDAASAVAAALEHEPDVCLLDVGLPGGGIAAAREIVARLPETRIIMLADDDSGEEALFAALRAGASSYLPKTAKRAQLLSTIGKVAAGEASLPDELVARLIEAFRDPDRPKRRIVGEPMLTAREWQVLQLMRQGRSTGEIAEQLVVSQVTVRSHVQAILRKLQLPNRAAAGTSLR
jgi:two-component system, NarL family, nitrate/nitrite response regulator NarL